MSKKWIRSILRSRFYVALLLVLQILFIIYVMLSGSRLSANINNLMVLISFVVSVYIISKKDKGAYKLTWIFMILIFPLFGGLFYLMFNFQLTYKRYGKRAKHIERKAKKKLNLPGIDYEEAKNKLPEYFPQIEYLQKYAGFPVYANTKTKYLTPGESKFEYLLKELEKAEKYIFLEYFIIQEGEMWDTILEVLKRKLNQGVLVRVIYDDMGCFFLLPKNYRKELKKYGIECCVFNPFRPFLSTVQNNRDHRKIAVIDGKVAFTGGINLADEYINAIEKHGHWKDASIMLSGKAAWSFTLMFLQMWELCTGRDEDYSKYYPWADCECEEISDGFVQPYSDSPMDKENVGEPDTMRERKQIMEDNADAFIVVPGGIGTYEEFFEILTSKQLCRHNKPIAVYDIDGFYKEMDEAMRSAIDKNFIKENCLELYKMSEDLEEIFAYIEAPVKEIRTVKELKDG